MPRPFVTHPQSHRFTIADYYAMGKHAILPADTRDELIEGEVIDTPAMGSRHAACVTRLQTLLSRALEGREAMVRSQVPIRHEPNSEPQPDLAIVRPRTDYYAAGHPTPADVLLLIEVADTSLAYDRDRKTPLYLSWGIPEVWVVNLPLGRIHVARPNQEEVTSVPGDQLPLPGFPGVVLAVADILG